MADNIYTNALQLVRSPEQVQAGLAQNALAQAQLQHSALQAQQMQTNMDADTRLRAELSRGTDPRTPEGQAAIMRADPIGGMKIQQQLLEQDKLRSETGKNNAQGAKADVETQAHKLELMSRDWAGLNPTDDKALVDVVSKHVKNGNLDPNAAAQMLDEVQQMNPTQRLQWYHQQALKGIDAKTNAELAQKQAEQARQAQQFAVTSGEQQRHNQVSEKTAQGQLGVAQGHLAVARQTAARVGIPSGYEQDPAAPGQLRPIAGGPADPSGGGGQGSRAELMFNRVVASANEATAALKNITELPITASTGYFGSAQPGTTLLGSTKAVLAQKMTSQEVQDAKVLFTGIQRNLGAIETSGLQVSGSLMHAMDGITINEGDTQMTKLRKLAEVRQIIEKGLEPNLSNPRIPKEQKDMVRKIISDVTAAVPYTHSEITKFQQQGSPQVTIQDFAKSKGLGGAPAKGPAIGTVEGGHRFKGGNPADPNSWEKI